MKKVCPNCGAETEGKFCPDCGTNLTDLVVEEQSTELKEEFPEASKEDADNKGVNVEPVENKDVVSEENPASSENKETASPVVETSVAATSSEAAPQAQKSKKAPKKLIGIIIGVIVLIAVAGAAFMFMGGGGSNLISKAYEEGTSEQKIGELSYLMPSSWKLDDTYSNPNAFYDTQRFLVKADDGSDAVDCYVKYCGESRYYGNSLEDYLNKQSKDEIVSEENLSLEGAEGKHICTSFSDTDGNNNYVDVYIVEAAGSIFTFEFDTNDSSHDQKGMSTIVNNAKFKAYKTPVQDAIVGKGKFADTANTIMRELICEMKKNNDSENLGCGEFTYYESSTKGGALCYAIQENGIDTGVAISFYKDKKGDNPVDSFDEIPVKISVATSMLSMLDYEDTNIALINGTLIQITGGVKYKQGYSKYVNGVSEATGIKGMDFYTNSFSLNDFDYDIAVSTKTGEYGVFLGII